MKKLATLILVLCLACAPTVALCEPEIPTLRIGIAQSAFVQNYETNDMTKLYEDALGINIEFVFYPGNDAKQKFSIEANSGSELADLYYGMDFADFSMTAILGAQGLILPLNDYFADPELAKWFHSDVSEENRDYVLSVSTMADGNIYSAPFYGPSISGLYSCRYWINQTWLDNLNLEMPSTTDEFYQVLKAFKEQDANGNGDPNDEIPLLGCQSNWYGDPALFLTGSFMRTNENYFYVNDEGELDIVYDKDEYRDCLEYMSMLCAEGLLDPVTYTQDIAQFRALIENANGDSIVGVAAMGSFNNYQADSPRRVDMVAMPPLEGPNGQRNAVPNMSAVTGLLCITKYCENPELAFKFIDFTYNLDVSMSSRYGTKDVDWTFEGADQLEGAFEEAAGIKCHFIVINDIWNQEQNHYWANGTVGVRDYDYSDAGTAKVGGEMSTVNVLARAYKAYAPYAYDAKYMVPQMVLSADELSELAMYNAADVFAENSVRFITGDRSLDEWDAYVSELNDAGLAEYITIYRAAYHRVMG